MGTDRASTVSFVTAAVGILCRHLSVASWVILSIVLHSTCAQAEEYTTINPMAVGQIRIAIPYCRGLEGELETDLARGIAKVLSDDLEFSGYFKRLDPVAYLEDHRTAGVEAGAFRFEDWTVIGTEYLLKTAARIDLNQITIEARLFDVFGRRQILGKRVTGHLDDRRLLLHRIANLVLKEVTGEEGVFDTSIVCEVKNGRGKDLYVLDYDGHDPKRVVSNSNLNLMPDWSPDGRYIAFTSYLKGNPDLYVLDVQRAMIKRISRRTGVNMSPDWSPDGKHMAVTMTHQGSTAIYVVGRNGTGRRRLTRELGVAVGPSWSPDGKWISFISDRTGSPQLYVMNERGKEMKRLSFGGSYYANPEWAPDGRHIAYAKIDGNKFDIFTIRPDGKAAERITDAPGSHEHPSWSPNSSYIVYQTTRHGKTALYIQNVRTGDRRRITPPELAASSPSWGPAFSG